MLNDIVCDSNSLYKEWICYFTKEWGLLHFFIPFFLFYIIPYVLISNMKLWKIEDNDTNKAEKEKAYGRFTTIISVIIALVGTVPNFVFSTNGKGVFVEGFLTGVINPVHVVMNSLPAISLAVIIALFSLIVIKGTTNFDLNATKVKGFNTWEIVGWFMVAFVVLVFLRATNIVGNINEFVNIFGSILGLIVIYYV